MDAMINFNYVHGNKITLNSSIGKIELTYMTREGQQAEWMEAAVLFAEMPDADLPYDEPARNEPTFFRAVLLDEAGKIAFMSYAVIPDEAIKELYRREAVSRMEAEFYPQPYNY